MVEIIVVKGPTAVISTGATIFQASMSKLRRPLDTVDLEQERLCYGSPVKVK